RVDEAVDPAAESLGCAVAGDRRRDERHARRKAVEGDGLDAAAVPGPVVDYGRMVDQEWGVAVVRVVPDSTAADVSLVTRHGRADQREARARPAAEADAAPELGRAVAAHRRARERGDREAGPDAAARAEVRGVGDLV